jgi:hypothetical protein
MSTSATYHPGRYRAAIVAQGFGATAMQKQYFFLVLRILAACDSDGHARACPTYEREYRQYLTTETGLRILHRDLQAMNAQVADLRLLEPTVEGHLCLVGREIDVTCHHEIYDGRLRERWTITRPHHPLDLNSLDEINARYAALVRGAARPASGPLPERPSDTVDPA